MGKTQAKKRGQSNNGGSDHSSSHYQQITDKRRVYDHRMNTDANGNGNRRGSRGATRARGNRDRYKHLQDRPYGQKYDYDKSQEGFQKFRDSHASNHLPQYEQYPQHISWNDDNYGHFSSGQGPPAIETDDTAQFDRRASQPIAPEVRSSPVCLPNTESKEVKPLQKIKSEKLQPESTLTVDETKKTHPPSDSSSDTDSDSAKKPTPVTMKTNEELKPAPNIKIKKEPKTTSKEKKATKEPPPPVAAPPSPSTSSSSDSSSSSSDSSTEEEVNPKMPQPIKNRESLKPKEDLNVDDVVCLGVPSNFENLTDDDETNEPQPCVVCNKKGHPPHMCQMHCRKCSHSAYETQTVCKNCGEIYSNSLNSIPKPQNPFLMFMQFMQYCMSQYGDNYCSSDIKYPFPQFENPSAPVLGTTPTVEVTRKDIDRSKKSRKRKKSELKRSRKKSRKIMSSDSDSDSNNISMATTSTKKQKKSSKLSAREMEASQPAQQQQYKQLPPFGGSFPAQMPFTGGFNTAGFNPMMAFNQMMACNPSAMNFSR